MVRFFKIRLSTLFILLLICNLAHAQDGRKQALETRRQELLQDIKKFNDLQAKSKREKTSELSLIENFNYKIGVLENLIKITNQELNYLTRDINNNQNKISRLRADLKQLKSDYAQMIVQSYKSKNKQNRLMFLLASSDFKQAYKRLRYMKQYTEYQKRQGEAMIAKTEMLQRTNRKLLQQKETKNELIASNKKTQKTLENTKQQHQTLIKSIQKNINQYQSEIAKKKRESDQINREIQALIKAAIARSNKRAGKSTKSTHFALTREERKLASSFLANKGKLPWPVAKGLVKLRFGNQPHPLNRHLIIKSNGVRILTEKGSKARAVFNGEVIGVVTLKNINPLVMIRHGNYITTYKNLSKVYVKEGEHVKTKQVIGEIATNKNTGETILNFVISKGSQIQNPALWIYKL